MDEPALNDDSKLPAGGSLRRIGRWCLSRQGVRFGVNVARMRIAFDPGSHIKPQFRPFVQSRAAPTFGSQWRQWSDQWSVDDHPLADDGCIQPRTDILCARLGALIWARTVGRRTLVHLWHAARLSLRAERPKPVGIGSSRLADRRGHTENGGQGGLPAAGLFADLFACGHALLQWGWPGHCTAQGSQRSQIPRDVIICGTEQQLKGESASLQWEARHLMASLCRAGRQGVDITLSCNMEYKPFITHFTRKKLVLSSKVLCRRCQRVGAYMTS